MFKNLALTETIWINALRTFCAGIVIMLISFFVPNETEVPFYTKFLFPFFVPIIYVGFLLIRQLLKVINLGGIGNVLCLIFAIPGDPLVYVLYKVKPQWVPVEEYSVFELTPYIKVFKDEFTDLRSNKQGSKESDNCPFAGDVIVEKETKVLGFSYPAETAIFSIDNNWNVYSKGKSFGYIDVDGNIRQGLKGDPKATLAGGKLIGQVRNGKFYS